MNPTLKLAALATAVILAACGGGGDDEPDAGGGGGGGGGGGALSCNFANYQAGAVSVATDADLATYAGSYDGEEGSFDANGAFVKSTDATMVLASSGSITYKGAPLTITSYCVDNTAGPFGKLLYVEFAGGKFDISTTDAGADLRWAWGVAPGGAFFRKGVKR